MSSRERGAGQQGEKSGGRTTRMWTTSRGVEYGQSDTRHEQDVSVSAGSCTRQTRADVELTVRRETVLALVGSSLKVPCHLLRCVTICLWRGWTIELDPFVENVLFC